MKRIAVTQEFLGDILAAQTRGEIVQHPAIKCFPNALFDGINKLVHKISHKYKTSTNEREDELFQICFYHLWKRIGKFDSSRGKFTTFVHWVCSNKMKTHYRNVKKDKEHYVEAHEESENQEGSELVCAFNKSVHVSDSMLNQEMADAIREFKKSDSMLNQEIADAIRELIKKYPSKRELTISILGKPDDIEKRRFNDEIKLSSIRGYGRKEKEKFYRQSIVPFFKVRFGGLHV